MNGIRIPDDWRWARVREDVAAGRLWKARDRLHGHLIETPADQDLLDMLGAIWFQMGDLPQAGRYWFLTEREDEAAIEARTAFYERFGHQAPQVLRALPRPTRPELYPTTIRERLEDLARGLEPPFVWSHPGWYAADVDGRADTALPRQPLVERLGIWAIVVSFVAVILVGFVTIVGWIVTWVVDLVT